MLEHVGEQPDERLARRRVAEGEVLERRHVVRAREQLADALVAVAAGAPDLLRVRLEALRQVVVVDVANVRLVDPHPERDRRDDDRLRRGRPPLLHGDPILRAHAGVIRTSRKTRAGQERGDSDRRPLKGHVHDRRPGRTLAQPLHEQAVALAGSDRCRQQSQVRPVEACDDRIRFFDPETRADVRDDGRRCRCSEREHAFGCELACPLGELEIVGPEVVPPLGDAVRLVDGEERDASACELGEEALVVEALRCDVEKLQ